MVWQVKLPRLLSEKRQWLLQQTLPGSRHPRPVRDRLPGQHPKILRLPAGHRFQSTPIFPTLNVYCFRRLVAPVLRFRLAIGRRNVHEYP